MGCQWSSRIPPGTTVISATATSFATLKTVESAILTVPPEYWVGATCENSYENGSGTVPKGLVGGCWSSGGGTGQ